MRLLLIAPLALAAGWLSIAISGANLLRPTRPDIALKFQPWDARAEARTAEQILLDARGDAVPPAMATAGEFARTALQRDVTIASAWRTVAMASQNPDQTAALFHFAGDLSRRDLPTQLWLIEERVRQNDIRGALNHYDEALRTSPASFDVLFPVLVTASADDNIRPHLAALLRTRPPWRRWFLEALAAGSQNPDKLVQLMAMAGRPASPPEDEIMGGMVRRLIDQGAYVPAWRMYGILAGVPESQTRSLANGGFERPNPYPPFDWQLETGEDLRAETRPGPGGSGVALFIHAATGVGGPVARQVLMLPPGTYDLAALAGTDDEVRPARLYWEIVCGNPQGTSLGTNEITLGPRTQTHLEFHVPATNCPAQWLRIGARADNGPADTGGWIDSLEIQRREPR